MVHNKLYENGVGEFLALFIARPAFLVPFLQHLIESRKRSLDIDDLHIFFGNIEGDGD